MIEAAAASAKVWLSTAPAALREWPRTSAAPQEVTQGHPLHRTISLMADAYRDELRARARAFIQSDAFEIHYWRKHPPRWVLILGLFVNAVQQRSIRVLIGGLVRPPRKAASRRLRRRYRQLVETGRIVQAFFVMENAALWSRRAIAPALMLASLDGMETADHEARRIAYQLADIFPDDEQILTPVVKAVADMLRDEGYRPHRKRRVPTEIVTGRELHLLDVLVDNTLRGSACSVTSPVYFVIDPAPKGLLLQIPGSGDERESP